MKSRNNRLALGVFFAQKRNVSIIFSDVTGIEYIILRLTYLGISFIGMVQPRWEMQYFPLMYSTFQGRMLIR